MTGNDPLS